MQKRLNNLLFLACVWVVVVLLAHGCTAEQVERLRHDTHEATAPTSQPTSQPTVDPVETGLSAVELIVFAAGGGAAATLVKPVGRLLIGLFRPRRRDELLPPRQ